MVDKRNSNIELLRILAASMVILLHFNLKGGIDNAIGVNQMLLVLIEAISISAVNVFMIISGYFGGKLEITLNKPLNLIIEVMFIKLLFFVGGLIIGTSVFTVKGLLYSLIPNNYFIIFYIAVYVISPFLNAFVNTMSSKVRIKFLVVTFVVFSVYPTIIDCINAFIVNHGKKAIVDISTISRNGSLNGFNIINFVYMYLIGAIIRENKEMFGKIRARVLFYCFGITVFVIYIWTYLSIGNCFSPGVSLAYCNPLVIVLASVIFLLFSRIQISNKWINKCAACALTVYLTHVYFIELLVNKTIVSGNFFVLVLYLLFVVAALYIVGVIVHNVYALIEKAVIAPITKLFSVRISSLE